MYSKTCILCQWTSLKCWFGKRTMTSKCDVTNSAQQIQMTALCHWMKPPHENFLRTPLVAGTSEELESPRTRNTSRSTAISDSSAGSTQTRDQARSELQSLYLVLRRPQGRFTVDLASSTCFANVSQDALDTWPNQRNWHLSIRRRITPWSLCKNLISAACTWDNILSAITQDSSA